MFKKIRRVSSIVALRSRGLWRAAINIACMKCRMPVAPCLPLYITIEPTAFCNLRCTVCETGNKSIKRQQGVMSMDDFKLVIDKIAFHTNTLLLYFMGEPFLNKSIYDMIAYARGKGIYVCMCTNGELMDAERLALSGINEVSFQVGGTTQDVHAEYREGANLGATMGKLKELLEAKKRLGKTKMSVEVGFIVMKHNEHQIDGFVKEAEAMGVDRIHVIKPRVRTIEEARRFLPKDGKYWLYDKNEYDRGVLAPAKNKRSLDRCFMLWNSAAITWNGDLVPCCNDPHGRFVMGNILKEDMKDIWNNERYRGLRRALLNGRKSSPLCGTCVE